MVVKYFLVTDYVGIEKVKIMRKIGAILFTALLLVLLVTTAFAESISQQKDITCAVNVDFTTMDPMDTSDTLSGGIQRMIMDGLFGFDDDMKIIPMLATGYTASDDATEFTITLREGISFTDGTPWNADAALANVAKWGDKELGLKRTTFLCNMLKSWEKIDDYTIKITLNEPFGAFISNLAHPACVIVSPSRSKRAWRPARIPRWAPASTPSWNGSRAIT